MLFSISLLFCTYCISMVSNLGWLAQVCGLEESGTCVSALSAWTAAKDIRGGRQVSLN